MTWWDTDGQVAMFIAPVVQSKTAVTLSVTVTTASGATRSGSVQVTIHPRFAASVANLTVPYYHETETMCSHYVPSGSGTVCVGRIPLPNFPIELTGNLIDNGQYGTIWHNIEYTWEQINGPAGSLETGLNLLYFTPSNYDIDIPTVGTYTFRYTIRSYARVGGVTRVTYEIHTSSATATLIVLAGDSDSSPPVSRELPPPVEIVEAPPLTADSNLQNTPTAHEGNPFRFRIAFSEPISISYRTIRDHSLSVTGGRVTGVGRVDKRSDLWKVIVAPDSTDEVTVVLEGDRPCDVQGAICATDGRRLSNSLEVRFPGVVSTGRSEQARTPEPTPEPTPVPTPEPTPEPRSSSVTSCATGVGELTAAVSFSGDWSDSGCRAHHRTDSAARYFRFSLSERTSVSISLSGDGVLFVSKGAPKNGWGTPPKGPMTHRINVP